MQAIVIPFVQEKCNKMEISLHYSIGPDKIVNVFEKESYKDDLQKTDKNVGSKNMEYNNN